MATVKTEKKIQRIAITFMVMNNLDSDSRHGWIGSPIYTHQILRAAGEYLCMNNKPHIENCSAIKSCGQEGDLWEQMAPCWMAPKSHCFIMFCWPSRQLGE